MHPDVGDSGRLHSLEGVRCSDWSYSSAAVGGVAVEVVVAVRRGYVQGRGCCSPVGRRVIAAVVVESSH